MSGGKGGSKTQQVQIPAWMEDVAKRNLARAEAMSKVGYQPYYGTDVVGFGPTGDMARQANIDAAIAFGMAPEGTKATRIGDMSSGTLYDQAVAEYERRNPGAASYYNQFFVDPVTGAAPLYDQAIAEQAARQEAMRQGRISPVLYNMNPSSGSEQGGYVAYTPENRGMMNADAFGNPMFTKEQVGNFVTSMIPGKNLVDLASDIFSSGPSQADTDAQSSAAASSNYSGTNYDSPSF